MGWYYSLGIVFENENLLNDCKKTFSQILKLSNGTEVRMTTEVHKVEYSNNVVLQLLPYGLSTDTFNGRDVLFKRPYFYEIRDFLYKQLLNLNINFKTALFELEAGDYLIENDIIEELNIRGIGGITFGYSYVSGGDVNASSISGKHPPEYYIAKRYFDGLILNKKEFYRLRTNQSEFQTFKENYYWIPLKELNVKK